MAKQLRWGFAGAGLIASDFVTSLGAIKTNDHTLMAVAARDMNRAEEFAKKLNISKAYQGYDKLAADNEVDIVYVSVLNPQHFEVCMLMLEHGKHVLCEKPLCMNEKQTRKVLDLAKTKNLFFMEAVWSRCFPAYIKMRQLIEEGAIGDIVSVTATFGFPISHVDRVKKKELGGGGILDLGIYTLQFVQCVVGCVDPLAVKAVGHLNPEGIDESMTAVMSYPKGILASVATNTRGEMPNEGVVVGTKGTIRMPDFWCPTKLITPNGELEFPLPSISGSFNYKNSVGLHYEAVEAKRCISSGLTESPLITHKESLQLAQFEDKLRADVGVVFPADSN